MQGAAEGEIRTTALVLSVGLLRRLHINCVKVLTDSIIINPFTLLPQWPVTTFLPSTPCQA